MNYINSFLPIFEHYATLAYTLVFVLSFLESFAFLGTIIPGTTFVVAIGFLSSQGFFHPGALFIFSVLGAIFGDGLSFYLGKHSEKLFKPDSVIFRMHYLEKGKNFTKKYGAQSIFLGRFFGPLRAVVPFVAGMFKMDDKKFVFYNVISALLWSAAFLSLGYFFGEAWQAISVWSDRFSVAIFWLAVFLGAVYLLKWLFIKKGKSVLAFLISLIISVGEGIKRNPDIQKFFARHPSLARFLQQRFERKKFSGLLLTILVSLSVYTAGLFVGVVSDVFITGDAVNADRSLENLFYTFRNPLLVKVFLWITLLGNWRVVAATILVILFIFWLWKKKNYIMPFLVGLAGSFATSMLGKYFWHRPRPAGVGVYIERFWSFPSEHAALAVSLYGFLVYFLWKCLKKWRNKIDILFLGLLIITLIGFSRLYLGVHYLSDVWAGYLVGIFWLIISMGMVESKNNKDLLSLDFFTDTMPGDANVKRPKHLKIITVFSLLLLVAGYVGFGLRYRPLFNYGGEEHVVKQIGPTEVVDIFRNYKLPKFTETLLGNPQEPFSFIIIADNDQQLIQSFQKAGWFLADSPDFNSLLTDFKFEVLNKAYPSAPMTPYFWQTYTNDYGFEQPTEVNSARYRHHARFWRTDFQTASGQNIYVGITSLDMGVKWWGITHKIKPDIDSEREYLFNALDTTASAVSVYEKKQFVDPVLGKNFTGDQFFTDGQVYIMYLK